jgi:hypothetical protein
MSHGTAPTMRVGTQSHTSNIRSSVGLHLDVLQLRTHLALVDRVAPPDLYVIAWHFDAKPRYHFAVVSSFSWHQTS